MGNGGQLVIGFVSGILTAYISIMIGLAIVIGMCPENKEVSK